MEPRNSLLSFRRGVQLDGRLLPYLDSVSAANVSQAATQAVVHFRASGRSQAADGSAEAIRHIAREFHNQAGTLTPAVAAAIASLGPSQLRLRFSHQINLFPSLGIFAQFPTLASIAHQLALIGVPKSAEIYVYVDYDVASDARFKSAQFPTLNSHQGIIPITGVVSHRELTRPMYAVPKPTRQAVDRWIDMLSSRSKADSKSISKLLPRGMSARRPHLDLLKSLLLRAFEASDTLATFNATFTSIVCNEIWGYRTIFLPGTLLQSTFAPGYLLLLEQEDEIKAHWNDAIAFFQSTGINIRARAFGVSDALLWWNCPRCLVRVPFSRAAERPPTYLAICPHCRNEIRASLEKIIRIIHDEPGRITPRIILDDLLDYISLGMSGGSGYIGAIEHRLLSNFVATKLGILAAPELLWSPSAISLGPVESFMANDPSVTADAHPNVGVAMDWLLRGRVTILYYMLYVGLDATKRALEQFLNASRVDERFIIGGCGTPDELATAGVLSHAFCVGAETDFIQGKKSHEH